MLNSEGELVVDDGKMTKERLIEKSLVDLNDNYSNIMLSSGYTPMELMRKESKRMLNRRTNQNEDENFQVQFESRVKNIDAFVKYFILYLENVIDVENQMRFSSITDQKKRYKAIKRKTFEIFKKGNKWVQLRFIFKQIENLHQLNAVFISNAVKGQLEAFLNKNNEKFSEFKNEYETLKKKKYKTLNLMDDLQKKHEHSKENLDEVLLQYDKAKKQMIKYNHMLEMEMKAKLAQKAVQDEAANVLATKDQIKELRDQMKLSADNFIDDLTYEYRNKLEVFWGVIFSLINAFSDLCGESVNLLDGVLVQDQAESLAEQATRQSLVGRGITNVKILFQKASPNRQPPTLQQLVKDNKKRTKSNIVTDMTTFKNLFKVTFYLKTFNNIDDCKRDE